MAENHGMDEQIEAMEQDYFDRQAAQEQAMRAEAHPMMVEAYDGMPQDYYDGDAEGEDAGPQPMPQYYPLSLAQGVLPATTPTGAPATTATPAGNFLTNRYAGVPGWGWGLITIGVLGGGYYLMKHGSKPKRNDGGEDEDDGEGDAASAIGSTEPAETGWGPSRSSFGRDLEKFISRRGLPAKDIKVYTDADEAKRYVKPVSPLVTIKCSTGVTMPMADLEKFASKEGLTATDHGSGVIGFYPRPNGKRGRAWEQYIDDLRDEGQSV